MERVRDCAGGTTPRRGGIPGWRAVALALLTSAMLVAGVSSASAVIVTLSSGKTVSYQPLHGVTDRSLLQPFANTENLAYHGGPVMTSNTNYTFYWAPAGSPAYPSGYQAGVNRYLENLAHDSGGNQNVDSVATQYTNAAAEPVKYASHFAGAIIDTNPYPANGCTAATICLTDAQLQTEIRAYVNAHGLPKDLAHEYFMLTPPGVESCFTPAGTECSAGATNAAYCAYHGFISVTGSTIVYANDPYVGGNPGCDTGQHPNNNLSDSALMGGLSHEHSESITDPRLNAWYAPSGEENGDKCRTFENTSEFGLTLGYAPDGSPYNQPINRAEYYYQQEWSNKGSVCRQRTGFPLVIPAITKLTPTAGLAAGGTSVTITGTGFTGASAVKFGSTPAASFKASSWTSITAVSSPGTSGSVDVTVTVPGGTSLTSSADLFRFQPPTITSVTPNSGPMAGGTSVTITGSGFALGSATKINLARAATGVECASTSVCTAISPLHDKPAVVDAQAIVNGYVSPKNIPADQFTYF
jgi:IPT/TIG domain